MQSYEFIFYNINCHVNMVYNCKIMKRKTEKQLDKELMDHIIRKKLPPQEARTILRAMFEKRIYEKTKKLH
jgi:hypothetical protein